MASPNPGPTQVTDRGHLREVEASGGGVEGVVRAEKSEELPPHEGLGQHVEVGLVLVGRYT